MIPKTDLLALVNSACDLMAEAAETFIVPRFCQLSESEIKTKSSPTDLVTIADIETEQWLSPRLKKCLPGSMVVGEEAASEDPSILGHFSTDRPVWVIDPVDGTRNFANGNKNFVSMLALVVKHRPVLGMIRRPLKRELFWAVEGQGAWRRNDNGDEEALRVRKSGDNPGLYEGYISGKSLSNVDRDHVRRNAGTVAKASALGCAGEQYIRLANGTKDYSIFGKLSPWDHAPGLVILREAGGYDLGKNGRPYTTEAEDGRLVVSTSRQAAELVSKTMFYA